MFNNGSATLSFDEGDLGGRGYNVSAGGVAGTYFATATAAPAVLTPVPTMSPAGLAAAILMLLGAAAFVLRRRGMPLR